jgi:hypothetical protein
MVGAKRHKQQLRGQLIAALIRALAGVMMMYLHGRSHFAKGLKTLAIAASSFFRQLDKIVKKFFKAFESI